MAGDANDFATSLGLLAIDADFMRALKGTLTDRSESLGWLLDQSSLELDDMLMRLSVLLGAGVVGASVSSGADA